MGITELLSYLTEENLAMILDKYRSLGPLPGLLLPFMKSFVPPLPTLVIISVNAAVYGLWLGFLYSWIGIVCGCLVTFAIVKKVAGHPYLERWAQKPKVQKKSPLGAPPGLQLCVYTQSFSGRTFRCD
jgi:uncharacterized membrane protein YdjX (TVP38/TMEM64 family)